ncbi:MAG: methyltransferase [Bacteroidota bacterium]|nr:methyltransferase [Bacteroidota bacterium]
MKVCTDSCLFGAWVAKKIELKIFQPGTVLDIGSGTGLLSLMIAQKSNAIIDAVEIDVNSFLQTKENFLKSQWNQRLHSFHADVKNRNADSKYDLIITNPPFFEKDLKAAHHGKNIAMHNEALTFTELLQSIKSNLAVDGNFAVLLPYHRIGYFKSLAMQNNFYLKEELLVKQTQKHDYFRGLLFFETKPSSLNFNEMTIKNHEKNYTEEFNSLLQDYYL